MDGDPVVPVARHLPAAAGGTPVGHRFGAVVVDGRCRPRCAAADRRGVTDGLGSVRAPSALRRRQISRTVMPATRSVKVAPPRPPARRSHGVLGRSRRCAEYGDSVGRFLGDDLAARAETVCRAGIVRRSWLSRTRRSPCTWVSRVARSSSRKRRVGECDADAKRSSSSSTAPGRRRRGRAVGDRHHTCSMSRPRRHPVDASGRAGPGGLRNAVVDVLADQLVTAAAMCSRSSAAVSDGAAVGLALGGHSRIQRRLTAGLRRECQCGNRSRVRRRRAGTGSLPPASPASIVVRCYADGRRRGVRRRTRARRQARRSTASRDGRSGRRPDLRGPRAQVHARAAFRSRPARLGRRLERRVLTAAHARWCAVQHHSNRSATCSAICARPVRSALNSTISGRSFTGRDGPPLVH